MKSHTTTFRQQVSTKNYLITCDACGFRWEGPVSRNEAHEIAYRHTVAPDA